MKAWNHGSARLMMLSNLFRGRECHRGGSASYSRQGDVVRGVLDDEVLAHGGAERGADVGEPGLDRSRREAFCVHPLDPALDVRAAYLADG